MPDVPNLELAREAFHDALLDDDAEKLYEQAPCGYLSTTPEGVIVKVNQTFLTWTGLAREALLGRRRFADLLTVGGRLYHETHFAPMLLMHGTVRAIALDVALPSGETLPVLVNAVLERDDQGTPRVIRVVLFDATERRRYERELLRAKRSAEASEERALALARTLQQTLIPPRPPAIPGLEVAAVYRPAGDGREVGGDFYDVFQVGEGDWVVALGDVAGKGVEAAVLTSLIRYSLRGISVLVPDPSDALQQLNAILYAHDTERFCTLSLSRLTRTDEGWRVRTSTAGHPPPVLVRPGAEPLLVDEPGFLVGAFEEASFSTVELSLRPGDAIMVHTDGVTEARRGDEFFGTSRVLAQVAAHGTDPAVLVDGLLADVLDFSDGVPRDDIAVLAMRAPSA